jgi:hypothetical protein
MGTDNHQPEQLAFCQRTALAMIRLKHRLQRKYEQVYPRLCDIIPAIVDQEEKNAWNLSLFPHLLLPDLVEGRIEKLDV